MLTFVQCIAAVALHGRRYLQSWTVLAGHKPSKSLLLHLCNTISVKMFQQYLSSRRQRHPSTTHSMKALPDKLLARELSADGPCVDWVAKLKITTANQSVISRNKVGIAVNLDIFCWGRKSPENDNECAVV